MFPPFRSLDFPRRAAERKRRRKERKAEFERRRKAAIRAGKEAAVEARATGLVTHRAPDLAEAGAVTSLTVVRAYERLPEGLEAGEMLTVCWMCHGDGVAMEWMMSYDAPKFEHDVPCLICFGPAQV